MHASIALTAPYELENPQLTICTMLAAWVVDDNLVSSLRSRPVLLKMWCPDLQHQCYLES